MSASLLGASPPPLAPQTAAELAVIPENENTAAATLTKLSPSRPPGLESAASVGDVRAALTALRGREASLASRLAALTASPPSADLGRLDALRTDLVAQAATAAQDVGDRMLSGAADTAGRLSARVRTLDLEKSRVEATLRAVEQVAELKACVHGAVGSMGAPQDWEAAAGYLARAAAQVPDSVVRSGFAAAAVPSVEVPDPPWVTLEAARESLCGLFLREFEAAAKQEDGGARVARFFKLFPLIGRAEVGLDAYGRYVCQGVAGTARATLRGGGGGGEAAAGRTDAGAAATGGVFYYANALTRLFSHIAQIVDSHGALVERHYGPGRMVRVLARLQGEADVQGGILLDAWADERAVERRLTDVRSYPFSFLVQSFLPPARPGGAGPAAAGVSALGGGGTPRIGTPRVGSPAVGGGGGGAGADSRKSEDECGVSMKEVDTMLTEMSHMLARWALYARFVGGKCRDPDAPPESPLTIPDLLLRSSLHRKISSRLTTPYTVMTTFFFRRSVEKAFQLDEYPAGLTLDLSRPPPEASTPPFIISAVDVVMYMASTVLQRTLATCQREPVAAVVPGLSRVLGADFVGMIQRRMRDEAYPKPTAGGGPVPEDKVVAFIVLINSLEVANEYLGRVVSTRLGGDGSGDDDGKSQQPQQQQQQQKQQKQQQQQHVSESFPFAGDAEFVIASVRGLHSSFVSRTTELLTEGVSVLFHLVVKPRLRTVLADAFRDVDYAAEDGTDPGGDSYQNVGERDGDDETESGEYGDRVSGRFERGWERLMRPLARIATPRPYGLLLTVVAAYVGRELERRAWACAQARRRASPIGAVRMERDFGAVAACVAGGGNYGVREQFARVMQVLMVANMEQEEWDEVAIMGEGQEGGEAGVGWEGEAGMGAGVAWVLTPEERDKARGLVRR